MSANIILPYTQNYRKEISKVRKQGMLTSPEHRRFRIRMNVAKINAIKHLEEFHALRLSVLWRQGLLDHQQ